MTLTLTLTLTHGRLRHSAPGVRTGVVPDGERRSDRRRQRQCTYDPNTNPNPNSWETQTHNKSDFRDEERLEHTLAVKHPPILWCQNKS